MSPESIGESAASISSAASSTLEASAPAVFSGISAPEIPSSIISEISRPVGLVENEFLPAPISGDFDIKDIIATPSVEHQINQIHIEPAVFLPPKTVEEIFRLPETPGFLQNEPVRTPDRPLEITKPHTTLFAPETQSVEVDGIEKSVREKEADQKALGEALAILKKLFLDDPEAEIWEEKLAGAAQIREAENRPENLAETITSIPQPNVQTETQTFLQPQTQTLANSQKANAETETQAAIKSDDENPQYADVQAQIEVKKKEKPWMMYLIDNEWEYAKRSNQIRLEDAQRLGQNIASSEDPLHDAQTEVPKLDLPSVEEAFSILAGSLKRPFIEHKIKQALSSVHENDPKQVAQTIIDVVAKNPSKEKRPKVKAALRLKPQQMPTSAQKLIAEGAKHLINKTGKAWRSVRRLNFREPVEAEVAA
jgi:hypothetical protein